ncbi:MAG: YbeD family protein [Candidatus Binatia bacterium]
MTTGDQLASLPGEYVFKIFGRRSPELVERVTATIAKTLGAVPPAAVRVRESSRGRYVSITIVVWAESRAQLERVYGDLRAVPDVLLYI